MNMIKPKMQFSSIKDSYKQYKSQFQVFGAADMDLAPLPFFPFLGDLADGGGLGGRGLSRGSLVFLGFCC